METACFPYSLASELLANAVLSLVASNVKHLLCARGCGILMFRCSSRCKTLYKRLYVQTAVALRISTGE